MSAKAADYHDRLTDFMTEFVFPAETDYDRYREEAGPKDHTVPPVVEDLKKLAKERGLWNLFLPAESGLTNLEYAPLAELTGWSMEIAPEVTNCAAPDTGNMETLHLFANERAAQAVARTAAGRRDPQCLRDDRTGGGLLRRPQHRDDDAARRGRLRHQRPQVVDLRGRRPALQDPDRDGPHQPGRGEPSAAVDDPGAHRHPRRRRSSGRCRCSAGRTSTATARSPSTTCGCPSTNLLAEEGSGFAIAQARLGPGRIHHCMRAIGVAERALALMIDRVQHADRVRQAAGRAGRGARVDRDVPQRDRPEPGCCATRRPGPSTSTATRARTPRCWSRRSRRSPRRWRATCIDRAIQVHGGAGVSDDFPLARMYGWHRAMRLFDGPDEVHMRTIARAELGREKSAFAAAVSRQSGRAVTGRAGWSRQP